MIDHNESVYRVILKWRILGKNELASVIAECKTAVGTGILNLVIKYMERRRGFADEEEEDDVTIKLQKRFINSSYLTFIFWLICRAKGLLLHSGVM